jgi:hypothetical protein
LRYSDIEEEKEINKEILFDREDNSKNEEASKYNIEEQNHLDGVDDSFTEKCKNYKSSHLKYSEMNCFNILNNSKYSKTSKSSQMVTIEILKIIKEAKIKR